MAALPRPTVRTIAFWILAALVLMLGVTLGNQDLVWPALFLVLLMVFSVVMTMLGNPGGASVGYAVALGTTAARLAK